MNSTNTLDSLIIPSIISCCCGWLFLLWLLHLFLKFVRHFKWYLTSWATKSSVPILAKIWVSCSSVSISQICTFASSVKTLWRSPSSNPFSQNMQFVLSIAWCLPELHPGSSTVDILLWVACISFEVLYFKWQNLCQEAWWLFQSSALVSSPKYTFVGSASILQNSSTFSKKINKILHCQLQDWLMDISKARVCLASK